MAKNGSRVLNAAKTCVIIMVALSHAMLAHLGAYRAAGGCRCNAVFKGGAASTQAAMLTMKRAGDGDGSSTAGRVEWEWALLPELQHNIQAGS